MVVEVGMKKNPARIVYHLQLFLRWFILGTLIFLAACRPPNQLPKPIPTASQEIQSKWSQILEKESSIPPSVIHVNPSSGVELQPDQPIEITFNQPMDQSSTASAWQLTDSDGTVVPGRISWIEPKKFVFKPNQKLEVSTSYFASISTLAKSKTGIPIPEAWKQSINTLSNLKVMEVFPANNTTDVGLEAVITVIFNRPVIPLVISANQAELPNPIEISPEVPGSGEWVNTSIFVYQAENGLASRTNYTVRVKQGLQDAVQEAVLEDDFSFQFTTISPRINSFELVSGRIDPQNQNSDLLLNESFRVSFAQTMLPESVEAALALTNDRGRKYPLETSWDEDYTQIVVTPTIPLEIATRHIFRLTSDALASDGGALEEELEWPFSTIGLPSIKNIEPGNGVIQADFNSELAIQFASPMNIDSVKERIIIEPEIEELNWYYNEVSWSFTSYGLKPATEYELTLLPGMEDIYGNEINTSRSLHFKTGNYLPSAYLNLPHQPFIFRLNTTQEFFLRYCNVPYVDIRIYRLQPEVFARNLISSDQIAIPSEEDLVWSKRQLSTNEQNIFKLISVEPQSIRGQPLQPGFYLLSIDAPNVPHESNYLDARLFVVADANLTFKSSATEGVIWLTDLKSGKPVPSTRVYVYDQDFNFLSSGNTDQDGLLKLAIPEPKDPYAPRFAFTAPSSTGVFAFASSQWGSGVSLGDYGMWSNYYAPAKQLRVYAYTDRPIYRPGQVVFFKGILRQDDDLTYQIAPQRQMRVRIESYKGTVFDDTLPISTLGSFDGQLELDREAAVGYYTIQFSLPASDPAQEQWIGSSGFSVAEYRKPEFQLEIQATPNNLLDGQEFTTIVQASYYSGGTLQQAPVEWTLTAEPFFFSPPNKYSGYDFSNIDYLGYSENFEGQTRTIGEGNSQTDQDGRFVLTTPVDLSQFKTSMRLTLETTVTDISGNVVSSRATVVAHQSQVYPGIRSPSLVGKAGDVQPLEMVVLDFDGNVLPNQSLTVEVFERRWHSVQQQDASGRVTWTTSVEDIPVRTFDNLTTDQNGETSVQISPPRGGVYRAYAKTTDRYQHPAVASTNFWVAGDEYIPWRFSNDHSTQIIANKEIYTPGEKAEILITSPFEGQAYALVTVERGRIRRSEVFQLEKNSFIYNLPVTADMAPNVYVSVLIVKGVDRSNPRPAFRMGITQIQVERRDQALQVELIPDRSIASPGDQVTYSVLTRDFLGRPVSAEVSLSLSDLAVLALTEPNSPPILDFFYDRRSLGVWTTMPLSMNIEDYNALIKENLTQGEASGSGGGKGDDEFGVIDVRENFVDTAYWNAYVFTDQDGIASVTLTLPDNLTTWRMDARAVTENTLVGQTTVDIVTSKPLIVRPQTPRFFIAGDQVRLGATLQNNTDNPIDASVILESQGLEIFSAPSVSTLLPPRGQVFVSWDVVVKPEANRVDLVITAEGDGLSDASRPPLGTLENQGLPVYHFQVKETIGTAGFLDSEGSKVEGIMLPGWVIETTSGQINLNLSHSLSAGVSDGLSYLEHFEYECIEQTISRFLPNVVSYQALYMSGVTDQELQAKLTQQVGIALQRLSAWQNPDGGWGWWPGEESRLLTSAYVALGLHEARQAGFQVDEDLFQNAASFLTGARQPISLLSDPSEANLQAFRLYVLARMDRPEISQTLRLFNSYPMMALYARAFLTEAMYMIDSEDARVMTLLSDINIQAILSATGAHWEEEKPDYRNWNSDTRTTAIILSVLSKIDPKNPINMNAVRWLMSNRQADGWQGTQDTAWTVMALSNWMVVSGDLGADYQFMVGLNDQLVTEGVVSQENLRDSQQVEIDLANFLPNQLNRLVIARDNGPGNLYYTTHMNLDIPAEKIQALDQGIAVARHYFRPGDLLTPVSEAQAGELLYARITIYTPGNLHYLLIDDPLPAGFEAIDQSLLTSAQNTPLDQMASEEFWKFNYNSFYFNHIEKRDEKVVLSATYLPAGTYTFFYMVRALIPGTFHTIPTTASEFYFPEVYGRGEGGLFTITP
jgi:hypothetical protein